MSPEQANDDETQPPQQPAGVLAALPRTRPQRTSARRTAARARAQSETATPEHSSSRAASVPDPPKKKAAAAKRKPSQRATAKPSGTKRPAAGPKATTRRGPPRASNRAPAQERAPKQGYDPEEEVELGTTVHPPSSGELIESIADIFGELASAGASAGGRLLKDALSVLRRP